MDQTSIEKTVERAREILDSKGTRDERLYALCEMLRDTVAHYDWVGFYLVEPGKRELVLGPYRGAPTEHVRIRFGQGICGQAADLEKTFVVQDVTTQRNYLSCSASVRSEIVVPIMSGGEVLGELDIDSHTVAPFTDADRALLDTICEMVAPIL